ncbi:MAG: SPOR domain-containing protein, partial [Deltaproteobacteria bacterium]
MISTKFSPDPTRAPRCVMRFAVPLAAAFVCAAAVVLASTPAGADVVTRIDQEVAGSDVVLRIELATPMRYLSHDPADRGDTLQIRLQALPSGAAEEVDTATTQVFSRKPSRAVPLIEVRYEGDDGGNPLLTLRFDRPVTYRVRNSADLRSVLVTLPGAAQAPAPPQEGAPARKRPATRQVSEGNYAVNLLSSRRPLSPSAVKLPVPLGKHTLYVTEFRRRGELWYRVRVGWFTTRPEAELFAARLRKTFPQAWVDRVSEAEKRAALGTEAKVPSAARPTTGRVSGVAPGELPPASKEKPTTASAQRAAELLAEARRDITARRYG